jgi:hypothetical protein
LAGIQPRPVPLRLSRPLVQRSCSRLLGDRPRLDRRARLRS